MVFHALQSVVSMLLVIAVGFFLCGAAWFREHGPGIFSKFVVKVALPCYLFINIQTQAGSREGLLAMGRALPVPALAILAALAAAALLARLLKVPAARRGVFLNAIGFSNTVFIGFAVVEVLLGAGALPDAMPSYAANSILFWTVGVGLLGGTGGSLKERLTAGLKRLFSPALVALLLGAVWVWFSLPLPDFVGYPLTLIGRTATGLSMLFIGCVIRRCNLRRLGPAKELVGVLLGRFLLAPGLLLLLCLLFPLPAQSRLVFLLISVMPSMTQMSIMAKETGGDYEYASVLVTLTTVLSLAVIPLYIWLAEHFAWFA